MTILNPTASRAAVLLYAAGVADPQALDERATKDHRLAKIINAAKKAKRALSHDTLMALEGWQSMNWDIGDLAKDHERQGPLSTELAKAFAPVRAVLRQQFGDTVPLCRGEDTRAQYRPGRQLYSWSYDREIAQDYAGQTPDTRKLPLLTDADIDRLVDRYERTGFLMLGKYRLKRLRDDPDYFDIYRGREVITDGDDVRAFIVDWNQTRQAYNDQGRDSSKVYCEPVALENIVWVTDDLKAKEFIVAQAPGR